MWTVSGGGWVRFHYFRIYDDKSVFTLRNLARRLRDTTTKAERDDMTKRKQIKSKLQCRSFNWFTETILKSLKRVNRRDVFGQINCGYNNEIVPIPLCLYPDLFDAKSNRNQLYWDQCDEYAPFTYHLQSDILFLYVDSGMGEDIYYCIGTRPDGTLSVDTCQSGNMYQQWNTLTITPGLVLMRSRSLDMCITGNALGQPVALTKCNASDVENQGLSFRRHQFPVWIKKSLTMRPCEDKKRWFPPTHIYIFFPTLTHTKVAISSLSSSPRL